MSTGGPGAVPPSDPRPQEPFMRDGSLRTGLEITHPASLVVFGILSILLGLVTLPGAVAIAPTAVPVWVLVVLGLVAVGFVALGALAVWAGRRRAVWQRELRAWQQRHPGA